MIKIHRRLSRFALYEGFFGEKNFGCMHDHGKNVGTIILDAPVRGQIPIT
jgi:hypothetical protein